VGTCTLLLFLPFGRPYGMAYPQGPAQVTGRLRFEVIGEAWRILQSSFGIWIPAILVVLVLSIGISFGLSFLLAPLFGISMFSMRPEPVAAITITYVIAQVAMSLLAGIFSYALMGGLYLMAIRQVRGERIEVGDVFKALPMAGNLIGAYLLTSLMFFVGFVLCILPGFVLIGLTMFTVPLIVDRRLGAVDAIGQSINALKKDWILAPVFLIVVGIVSSLGVIACGIGLLFTYPLLFLCLALAYRDIFDVPQQPAYYPPTGMPPSPPTPPMG
jgi:uncharacterized membrane protein